MVVGIKKCTIFLSWAVDHLDYPGVKKGKRKKKGFEEGAVDNVLDTDFIFSLRHYYWPIRHVLNL